MSGQLRFPNINTVVISGRLVRDIELRYPANGGQAIAPICIAVNHNYQDQYGNWQEEASFVDAVAFGKNAQKCQECLKKGSPVLLEGNLRTRTFTDKNNVNRKMTEVIINRVYPLERDENYVANQNYQQQNAGGYQNNSHNAQQKPFNPAPTPATSTEPEPTFPSYDQNYPDVTTTDDVPF